MNLIIICYLLVLVIYMAGLVLVARWMYYDAKSRDMNPWGWLLITCLFSPNFIGLILYLLFRRKDSEVNCIQCGKRMFKNFNYCPLCGSANVQKDRPAQSFPPQKMLNLGIILMVISILGGLVVFLTQIYH